MLGHEADPWTLGAILIQPAGEVDSWEMHVNGRCRRVVPSLDGALVAASNVVFARGEAPGTWRVLVRETPGG